MSAASEQVAAGRTRPAGWPAVVLLLGAGWAVATAGVTAVLLAGDRTSSVSQTVGTLGFFAALVFATVCCARAARRRGPARRAWVMMTIAMALAALGQLTYVVAAVTGDQSSPSLLSDTISFVGYAVPLLAALFLFPRPPERLISRFRELLDIVVIVAGTLMVSEFTVLHPVREVADPTTGPGLLLLAYPVADLVICAVVLCLGMRQLPADRLIWLVLGSGMVVLATTDSIYVRLLTEGQTQLTATPLVAGWMISAVLIGLSTLVPSGRTVSRAHDTTLAVQLVPYVPVVGAVVVLVFGRVRDDVFLLVGGVVLLVAVSVRQVMIIYENVVLTRDLEAKVAARTAELTTLGSIVTSSADAIVGVSLDGVITAWNPAAERLYGRPAHELLGRTVDALTPTGAETVHRLLSDARAGRPLESFEIDWRRNGGTVPVAVSVSPVINDAGRVVGISVSGQDITERRREAAALQQAREEALESSRLKSEFLATMSHEIRTPMNGVVGLTALLLETNLDAAQRQYAEGVRSAGEALLSVINDILDFSKLEAGKVLLDPVDFDPRTLVEEVAALLVPAVAAKRLELIAYCLPEVPAAVRGDANRIRQILLNLAFNAVKFTERGEVAIKVRHEDIDDGLVRLQFDVTDTGIGISPEDQSQVFEAFSQADASTTRRFGGTGLGLAISRRLVGAMGGTMGVESEPGSGSHFWFALPLPLGQASTTGDRSHTDLLDGLRALVVDDNATNRSLLEAQFRAWRMEPKLVGDPSVVLDLVRARAQAGRPFDVAILDMCMPGLSGIEVARRLSADPIGEGLPIILLTSSPPADPEVIRSAGIRQWLSKPVRTADLFDRLVRLVAPREAELEARRRSIAINGPQEQTDGGPVLVVEDNALNQLVAEGVLGRLGYPVETASDGREALAALAARSYRAVLMDCHMPGLDGFAATREIRRREAQTGRRTPVIAMTAGALPGDRERCLSAGMDAYLSKPIDAEVLRAVLQQWDRPNPGPRPVGGAPPEHREGHSVIDRSRVAELADLEGNDGSRLLDAFVASFLDRSTERLAALRAAAARPDFEAVSTAAHELNGSAGTIGAIRVAALARAIEQASRAHRPVPAERLDELADAMEQANRELVALTASTTG